jgi:hypothetical protein
MLEAFTEPLNTENIYRICTSKNKIVIMAESWNR